MARVSILLTDGVRLANKLYMHAAVLAWCLESGHTLIDPCMYPYARHFPSLRGNLLCSPHHRLPVGPFLADPYRPGRPPWFLTRGLGKLGLLGRPISPPRGDWNPVLLPPSGPEPSPSARAYAILRWGMQNHLGMVKHHEAITRHLAPLPSIVRDADTFAAALPPGRPAIGVHIRHGDYRTALQGWYFVPLGDTVREMHRFRDALADLNRPLPVTGRFDLAMCLEVVEHLPPDAGDAVVASLCALADTVLFSAAVPGQGGTGHLNEQWPEHWCERFLRHGFIHVDCVRPAVWTDERVSWWYRQNTLLFLRPERLAQLPALQALARTQQPSPLAIAHPHLVAHLAARR